MTDGPRKIKIDVLISPEVQKLIADAYLQGFSDGTDVTRREQKLKAHTRKERRQAMKRAAQRENENRG